MSGLRSALAFLTILPVSGGRARHGPDVLPWFFLVGLILGGLWAGFDWLIGRAFLSPLQGWLDMVFLVLLTGGLHVDGLADAADGLLSHRGRDEALRIMRDSRIGTWGVLTIVVVLGTKAVALSQPLMWPRYLVLLLIPAYGRLAMLLGIRILPYGRPEGGLANGLFDGGSRIAWIPGILILAAISGLMDWPGFFVVNGVFVIVVFMSLWLFRLRVACITGDMMGALGELTEAALLLALSTR